MSHLMAHYEPPHQDPHVCKFSYFRLFKDLTTMERGPKVLLIIENLPSVCLCSEHLVASSISQQPETNDKCYTKRGLRVCA